jgi:hypothetical protein
MRLQEIKPATKPLPYMWQGLFCFSIFLTLEKSGPENDTGRKGYYA